MDHTPQARHRVVIRSMSDVLFCRFRTETLDNGLYRHTCRREGCGRVCLSIGPRMRAVCRVRPERNADSDDRAEGATASVPPPSLLRRLTSFAAAEARWFAAGQPVRDEHRINEIFGICRRCEHFTPGDSEDKGSCRVCGCQLKKFGGLLNKIAMATESCPAQPAKWTAEAASSPCQEV